MSVRTAPTQRLQRLQLPERTALIGRSLGDAERAFEIFADGEQLLNLTYADTTRYPAPSWAADTFVAATRDGEAYTPYRGSRVVLQELAGQLSTFLGVDVDPEQQLAVTPGTQAGLFSALAVLVEHGDRVALPDPEYLSTERMIRFMGGEVVHIDLDIHGDRSRLDLDALEEHARNGLRLLVLSHPNNPTGAVYDEDTITELARIAAEYDMHVLVDELYSRLVYDDAPYFHLAATNGISDRVVTLLGPSKTEQMSGYRLGCVVGAADIIRQIEDVQSVTAIRAPAYAQHLMRRWLRDDREFLAERIVEYTAMRDLAHDRLSALDFVDIRKAQGTSYMFPSVRRLQLPDEDVAGALARKAGVIVNPGFQFGPRGVGSFRICFAQEEQAWSAALDRIVSVLRELAEQA